VIPAGTRHAYRNKGIDVAHVVCRVTPPSMLQGFLEEVAALSRAGRLTRRGLPRSLGGLFESTALTHRHREIVTLLFPPLPPPIFQRLLIPPSARQRVVDQLSLTGELATDFSASPVDAVKAASAKTCVISSSPARRAPVSARAG
jgi:hypothetical protein